MSKKDGRVDKLKNLLGNGHNTDEIVEQSAQTFGVSVPHLKKLFKLNTGKTIIQFDNDLRLERAKKMFEDPETTYKQISEICHAVGYENLSKFGKDFKKKFGVAPKQFQNECWLKLS